MNDNALLHSTRRHFFRDCAIGVGSMALSAMIAKGERKDPLAPKKPHFPAKAKNVIFLFMAGAPSQLELFDHKPKLTALHGQPIPEEFVKGKRFAFMDSFSKERPKLLASKRKFARHGQAGSYVSECLPHTASVVDDLA